MMPKLILKVQFVQSKLATLSNHCKVLHTLYNIMNNIRTSWFANIGPGLERLVADSLTCSATPS